MRIFGYGSLMWGDWEESHNCTHKEKATLNGYRRDFNKASVKNWGTVDNPGPTLNLVQEDSSNCIGITFKFSDEQREDVLYYLKGREGMDFELRPMEVSLENGETDVAYVPIYTGSNIIERPISERVNMAKSATGRYGNCVDYINKIEEKLRELGIDDDAVNDFHSHLS